MSGYTITDPQRAAAWRAAHTPQACDPATCTQQRIEFGGVGIGDPAPEGSMMCLSCARVFAPVEQPQPEQPATPTDLKTLIAEAYQAGYAAATAQQTAKRTRRKPAAPTE